MAWLDDVIVGHGLCPWAIASIARGRLRIVVCPAKEQADAEVFIRAEARKLYAAGVAPLSNTLVILPHVEAWQEFKKFEDWLALQQNGLVHEAAASRLTAEDHEFLAKCHLVAFHPEFARWRGLAAEIKIGSSIRSHYEEEEEEEDGSRSEKTLSAVVVETDPEIVGARHLAVSFVDGRDQIIPIEWISPEFLGGPLLPDNAMLRTPLPTLHLFRCADTVNLEGSEGSEEAFQVTLRNALHMAEVGLEGLR